MSSSHSNLLQNLHALRKAQSRVKNLSPQKRTMALSELAVTLELSSQEILQENKRDLEAAQEQKLSSSLLERLTLTPLSIQNLAQSVRDIAQAPEVLGVDALAKEAKKPGLKIYHEHIPLGVILMIFESRPNVLVDALALCLKSGNALALKGGQEAKHTNAKIFSLIKKTLSTFPGLEQAFLLLETREDVSFLIKQKEAIDLVIARGGQKMIEEIKKNSSIPVMAHDRGLCHVYVHHDFERESAEKIILNSKCSRPGVCNAMETLLIHKDHPDILRFIEKLIQAEVTLFVCSKTLSHLEQSKNSFLLKSLSTFIQPASEDSWQTEWLSKKCSFKIVESAQEALEHISLYTSHHTEAILTHDQAIQKLAQEQLDSSCLMFNASTRFNDGGELGLGAEIGISTSKFHAYGPVGARELTTQRTLVFGEGHVRE
jgi:glutamate-5-semialdehyde dehydrogenase